MTNPEPLLTHKDITIWRAPKYGIYMVYWYSLKPINEIESGSPLDTLSFDIRDLPSPFNAGPVPSKKSIAEFRRNHADLIRAAIDAGINLHQHIADTYGS